MVVVVVEEEEEEEEEEEKNIEWIICGRCGAKCPEPIEVRAPTG